MPDGDIGLHLYGNFVGACGILTPEGKPRPGAGQQRLLVNQCCGRGVLECSTGGIEDDDLVVAFPYGATAGDDLTEFRANVVARNETARNGVMQVSHFHALGGEIADDGGSREQLGFDFLLVRTVGAHGGDESTGFDMRAADEPLPGGCARHDNVTGDRG